MVGEGESEDNFLIERLEIEELWKAVGVRRPKRRR